MSGPLENTIPASVTPTASSASEPGEMVGNQPHHMTVALTVAGVL